MSRWQITLLLARWEFRRFFKWKGQLISMAIMALFMLGTRRSSFLRPWG